MTEATLLLEKFSSCQCASYFGSWLEGTLCVHVLWRKVKLFIRRQDSIPKSYSWQSSFVTTLLINYCGNKQNAFRNIRHVYCIVHTDSKLTYLKQSSRILDGNCRLRWQSKGSTLSCAEILNSSIMQVSRKQNLAPNVWKYAQQSILRSKKEQQL